MIDSTFVIVLIDSIDIIAMFILGILIIHYAYKLKKVDEERFEGIRSIVVFASALKIFPISYETSSALIISLFSLALFLSKAGLKAAEMEKNEKLNQSEENDISEEKSLALLEENNIETKEKSLNLLEESNVISEEKSFNQLEESKIELENQSLNKP